MLQCSIIFIVLYHFRKYFIVSKSAELATDISICACLFRDTVIRACVRIWHQPHQLFHPPISLICLTSEQLSMTSLHTSQTFANGWWCCKNVWAYLNRKHRYRPGIVCFFVLYRFLSVGLSQGNMSLICCAKGHIRTFLCVSWVRTNGSEERSNMMVTCKFLCTWQSCYFFGHIRTNYNIHSDLVNDLSVRLRI